MNFFSQFFAALFLISLSKNTLIQAKDDPYNSYLWNRSNALSNNGKIDKGDWFEWWYYKAVIPETGEAFMFTYGIINPWDIPENGKPKSEASKAVVSFGDFSTNELIEQAFSVSEFKASYNTTSVQIANNNATDLEIKGHIQGIQGQDASWNLQIENDWKFNAMGWGMHIKGLSNIFWYPAQASAWMTGWIEHQGRHIKLNHVPAYQDRNWGRSFPKWWTWLVSNHFENSPGTVLAAGGGQPNVFERYPLNGLTVGLRHEGREYIFRTTDKDKIKMDIRYGKWEVIAENLRERLVISAYAPPEKFMLLPFHTPSGQEFYDYEALTGDISVKVFHRHLLSNKWVKIADLITHEGGIEYGSPEKQNFEKSHISLTK